LTARLVNAAPGIQAVRFSVSVNGGPFRVIRDFSQQRDFAWSPALYEHDAIIRVTVRGGETKQTAENDLRFRIASRVKGTAPVITRTAHPLVALFSAPPCAAGSNFRVAFRRHGDETINRTSFQPCKTSVSNNVYVAGMRADTEYRLRSEVASGQNVNTGVWLPFHTGLMDGDFPPVSVPVKHSTGVAVHEPFLVHSTAALTGMKRPFTTDLNGDTVWYSGTPFMLTRVLPEGRFLGFRDALNSINMIQRWQALSETDLLGNTIRETNASRVAEQLEKFGIRSDCRKGGAECVSSFHHEALRLPNGHTLTIMGLERMFPAGTQGSKEPLNITGDIVVDLDEDFQVTAVWNAFDHLDLKRAGHDDGTCKEGPGFGGCTPIFLTAEAREWLHSNALNYIQETGDFLISMPAQSWVAKVDWKNGKGSGKVLWRLGEGGDFNAKSSDPHPWFDSQHDASVIPGETNLISLLDNSTARNKKDPKANTRGQVWKIDEQAGTATLVHNADLDVFSFAVGSAQKLKTGGYTFQAGFVNPMSVFTRAVETSTDGKILYAQQLDGVIAYRSFRVADMYSAPGQK
jgi:arylsulfate sulfotransferase